MLLFFIGSPLHADPSLTIDTIQAAVEAVKSGDLATVLEVPDHKMRELKKWSINDKNIKRGLVTYYINIHPSASWAHIGGKLLFKNEKVALDKVKDNIVSEQGM